MMVDASPCKISWHSFGGTSSSETLPTKTNPDMKLHQKSTASVYPWVNISSHPNLLHVLQKVEAAIWNQCKPAKQCKTGRNIVETEVQQKAA
jgi:hypothetical protein